MKKIFFLIPVLLFAISVSAQPPVGPADKGMTFGAQTSENGAVSPETLPEVLKGKKDMAIKVKGKVTEVCKMEGCWLKMETANGPMMIKMKDHSFMVPLAMNGKTIVAEGTANYKETSVEMQQHYAKDAGKSETEIAAITTPKKEIIMEATGIVVL
ncbi:hypothetical protein BH11BAC3_BH11BAC3_33490 [soil metagenome]